MRLIRQHYVIILDLQQNPVHSRVDGALPKSDEYSYRMKETGFPDHVIVYQIQALTPRELKIPPPSLEKLHESWRKPSEFLKELHSRKPLDDPKENRPPHHHRPLSTPSPTNKFSCLDVAEITTQTALHLHILLDGLPSCLGGETLLTILWPSFCEGDPILPEDHVELFGALKRAREWFDARLFFGFDEHLRESEHDLAEQLWNAFVDCTRLSSADFQREHIFDQNFIWSGSVGDSKSRFCLRRLEVNNPPEDNSDEPRNTGSITTVAEVNVESPVRLLPGHCLKLKEFVNMRKLPMHLIESDPQFYITADSLIDDQRSDADVIEKLFSAIDASFSNSFVAILTLEFALDDKPAPSSKENGAGRRPWDKMAASSSGTPSLTDEEDQLSPMDFVFNKPHVTREIKHCREKRSIDFVAFPPRKGDAAFIRICKLRDETEVNSEIFGTKITPDDEVDAGILKAMDRLPVLRSSAAFVQCIEKFHGDRKSFEIYLKDLKELSEPDNTSFEKDECFPPEDILSRPTNDFEILNRGMDSDAEKQRPDANEIEAELAAGTLMSNMKALVKTNDDPFCSKIRVEDILSVYRPRLDSLSEEMKEKRQRQSSFEGAVIATIPWPDVKEIQWHDVYYNRGSESEEKAQEIHLLKVRWYHIVTQFPLVETDVVDACIIGFLMRMAV